MLSRALLLAALAAALSSAASQAPDDALWLRRATRQLSMTVGANGLSGDAAQLQRRGERLEGKALGEEVSLQLRGDEVTGSVGGRAVELRASRVNQALEGDGTWAGVPLHLRVDPRTLEGHVGACAYALTREGGDYAGRSSCTGVPAPTSVHIPAALRERPPAEQLATLALLLSSSVGADEVTGTKVVPQLHR